MKGVMKINLFVLFFVSLVFLSSSVFALPNNVVEQEGRFLVLNCTTINETGTYYLNNSIINYAAGLALIL